MINPEQLAPNEEIEKTTAESNYWFKEARDQYNRAEHLAATIRTLREERAKIENDVAELRKDNTEFAQRLSAVTDLQLESRRTGYATPWNMGGVTLECLRDEITKARDYVEPKKAFNPVEHMKYVGVAQIVDGTVVLDSYAPPAVAGVRKPPVNKLRLYVIASEVKK